MIERSVVLAMVAAACSSRITNRSLPAVDSGGWAQLARADVDAIHDSIVTLHPAIRDPLNPSFASNIDVAYRRAHDAAGHAKSFLDWRAVVNGLILSFRDEHTFIRFDAVPARARWPGFLIDGRGGGYVAAGVDPALQGIAAGDRLIACDGQPIATLLHERLDSREADWSKVPEQIRQAWRLFVDYDLAGAVPLHTCTFDHGGRSFDLALEWRVIQNVELVQRTAPLLRRPTPHRAVSLSIQADGTAVISLGSLGDERDLKALEQALRANQTAVRAAPSVIFDLRGDAGGNSTWGEVYAAIVFGDAVVEAIEDPALGKYFRASPEAVARLDEIARRFAAEGPDTAKVARYWRELADRVAASPDHDTKLFTDYVATPTAAVAPASPARTAPTFVLTDAGCFSSCVIVANTLTKLGAISVGEVSGQNEEYGEVIGPIELPSHLASYWVPLSIIRQHRDQLGGLPVVHPWAGAMDDDAGILSWLHDMVTAR